MYFQVLVWILECNQLSGINNLNIKALYEAHGILYEQQKNKEVD